MRLSVVVTYNVTDEKAHLDMPQYMAKLRGYERQIMQLMKSVMFPTSW